MSRSGEPRIVTSDQVLQLKPLSFDDRRISEGWLQDLLNGQPELLPIGEIGAAWGPLVSLGREVQTEAGPIDNLFVSPEGELTVVETKLWRNPEARRKVVGQILDYASALARMSFEDLESRVDEAAGASEGIWGTVKGAFPELPVEGEGSFVDTVSRNLREGRFLLLIVGDGIREDIHGLADLIGRHPDLGFHLELVEIRVFETHHDELLVVPTVIGRTNEIDRATVRVERTAQGDVTVSVTATIDSDPETSKRRKMRSIGDFVDSAKLEIGEDRATAAANLMTWWEAEGGILTFNIGSVNLGAPFLHNTGGKASLIALYTSGECQLSGDPLTSWRQIITGDELGEITRRYGFSGHPKWPRRNVVLSDDETFNDFRLLLTRLGDSVRQEERRLSRVDPPHEDD